MLGGERYEIKVNTVRSLLGGERYEIKEIQGDLC